MKTRRCWLSEDFTFGTWLCIWIIEFNSCMSAKNNKYNLKDRCESTLYNLHINYLQWFCDDGASPALLSCTLHFIILDHMQSMYQNVCFSSIKLSLITICSEMFLNVCACRMGRGENMGNLTQPSQRQKEQQQEPLDMDPLFIRFLRTFREILKFVLFSYTVLFGALLLARWTTYFMVGK